MVVMQAEIPLVLLEMKAHYHFIKEHLLLIKLFIESLITGQAQHKEEIMMMEILVSSQLNILELTLKQKQLIMQVDLNMLLTDILSIGKIRKHLSSSENLVKQLILYIKLMLLIINQKE